MLRQAFNQFTNSNQMSIRMINTHSIHLVLTEVVLPVQTIFKSYFVFKCSQHHWTKCTKDVMKPRIWINLYPNLDEAEIQARKLFVLKIWKKFILLNKFDSYEPVCDASNLKVLRFKSFHLKLFIYLENFGFWLCFWFNMPKNIHFVLIYFFNIKPDWKHLPWLYA